jgi:transcription antitermination factor NusG
MDSQPDPAVSASDSVVPRVASAGLNWFAVFTSSHHEKRVSQYFEQSQIESFLPLYVTRRRRANRCTVQLELPLFPNYLFVHINRQQRRQVLQVPGVLNLVGSATAPAALPDFEIESLRDGLHLRTVEPYPYLVIGERARITAGALAGMEGVLLRKKNGFRVVLALDQIMQSVAVEVDADELEPLSPKRHRN